MQRVLPDSDRVPATGRRAWLRLRTLALAPAALLAAIVTLQAASWTITATLVNSAPPLDVVEGYMWGREWVLATYKHPAMPSWALETSRILTGGAVGWPAYLVSEFFIAAAFALVFAFGRDVMGARKAAIGTLLLAPLPVHTWLSPEFNHNIASLPFWAGTVFALWRAVERGSVVWWVALGAFAGVGMYAKLSMVALLVAAAGWAVWDEKARGKLGTAGPWIALAVFAAVVAPLALWLVEHRFAPLAYASERAYRGGESNWGASFFATGANVLAVLAALWIAGMIGSKNPGVERPARVEPRAVRYMAVLLSGPLLLTMLAALATGAAPRPSWSNSMFGLVGLLATALLSPRASASALMRTSLLVMALLVVFPLGYAAALGPDWNFSQRLARVQWPQAGIADRLQAIWSKETGGRPLRIVAGSDWVAGLVGLTAPGLPSILSSGPRDRSPWISPERIHRQGMLIVWDGPQTKPPGDLERYGGRSGTERFKTPGKRPEIVLHYIVVLPQSTP